MLPLLLAVALLQDPAAQPAAAPEAAAAPTPATPAAPAPRPARPERRAAVAPQQPPVLQGFGRPTGKRFTGEMEDTEVDDALREIAKAAGLSIVLPPGHRHERINANFVDAPVEDALRAVLLQGGLVAERQGSIIEVRESGLPPPGREKAEERRANEATREADRETRRAERGSDRPRRDHRDRVMHGDTVVRSGESVRDVVAFRGNVTLEPGARARDAVAILGHVTLESGARVRQAVAIGGDLRLGPRVVVERDAVSVGGEVKSDPTAEVGGETTSVSVPDLTGLARLVGSHSLFGRAPSPLWAVGQVLAKFVVFFVLALALVALFPRRVDAVAAGLAAHPWKSVLTGFLGVVVAPIVIVLLVATLIGIPLVPVAALAVLAAGILGFTALSVYLGRALPVTVQRNAQVLQLALGTAMVVVITSIPVLGCMAWIAAALLTFGAVLRTRFGTQAPALPMAIPPAAGPPPATPA